MPTIMPANRISMVEDKVKRSEKSRSLNEQQSVQKEGVLPGAEPELIKTRICRHWQQNHEMVEDILQKNKHHFSDIRVLMKKCDFAHGATQLRVREVHVLYKTRMCKTWQAWSEGLSDIPCLYGNVNDDLDNKCHFMHGQLDDGQRYSNYVRNVRINSSSPPPSLPSHESMASKEVAMATEVFPAFLFSPLALSLMKNQVAISAPPGFVDVGEESWFCGMDKLMEAVVESVVGAA